MQGDRCCPAGVGARPPHPGRAASIPLHKLFRSLFYVCVAATPKNAREFPGSKKWVPFSRSSTFRILISKPEQHSKISSRFARSLEIPKNPLGICETHQEKMDLTARGRLGRSNGLEKRAPRVCVEGQNPGVALRRPAA